MQQNSFWDSYSSSFVSAGKMCNDTAVSVISAVQILRAAVCFNREIAGKKERTFS